VATSVREIRALTVDFARTECNADDQLLGDIALCVSEAAANVIAHAYTQPGGDILLTATLANHTISIEIRDQGSRRTTPSPWTLAFSFYPTSSVSAGVADRWRRTQDGRIPGTLSAPRSTPAASRSADSGAVA
jgi:hypothetical protein